MTKKEIIAKYRVYVPSIHGPNKLKNHLIFDTLEEANQWLKMTELIDQIKAEKVEGTLVNGFQPTSFGGLGIWGRNIKVWKALDEV